MNRRLLLRLTVPSLIIGLSFFAACLISIRYIHRLQMDLADILAENVTSLQAAQELQIRVRQLRFHNLLYLLNPQPKRLEPVEDDQAGFEEALAVARRAARTPEEQTQVDVIEKGYTAYKAEQARLRAAAPGVGLAEAYKA